MLDRKVSEALEWLRLAKDKFREFAYGDAAERSARPKIGLALAGGFARGIAHIGVLRAFRDAGIPIDCVAGTSVGALIGAGFCSGISLEKCRRSARPRRLLILAAGLRPGSAWRPTCAWKNILRA